MTRQVTVFALTETWLTESVTDASIFIPGYRIFRRDRDHRQTDSSRHGGVLIGIADWVKANVAQLSRQYNDCVSVMCSVGAVNFIVCCIYNPPSTSFYHWPLADFSSLVPDLARAQSTLKCLFTIICGDINFTSTNWIAMSSANTYEYEILKILSQYNFEQLLDANLDVILCNADSFILNCCRDKSLSDSLQTMGRALSDHQPYCIEIDLSITAINRPSSNQFSYSRVDWE